ncbi:hypothetical protein AOQ84DRAFT_223233 [Glonium stellatum]|uniref:Uncharacterized protein n=1 Tax=Glonium stellatum TaxID=574774 RepID=A0A8E2JS07_9PEZI|nr:hypothetical protein AOQ84DRAFT_223233 [Glonium stellatum]
MVSRAIRRGRGWIALGGDGLKRASVQLADVVGTLVVARLGARTRSAADGGISGKREGRVVKQCGQNADRMRTETSDSNYNISTAAQPSGKNERKRRSWAEASVVGEDKAREGKRSGEWRRRCYLSAGQAMSRSPEARWLREHGGVQTRPGPAHQLKPIGRGPQRHCALLRTSPLAAPKITPRMIVSAWLLEVWSQHGASTCCQQPATGGQRPATADFCSPTTALLACPLSDRPGLPVGLLGRGATHRLRHWALARRRDLALSGAWACGGAGD